MPESFDYNGNLNAESFRFISTTPFYPIISAEGEDQIKIKFADGYLFDYPNGCKVTKIISKEFVLPNDSDESFIIRVEVSLFDGSVIDANILKEKFSESGQALGVKTEFDPPNQSSLTYDIHLADLAGGFIKDLYLQSNIHWFMRGMEQLGSPAENIAPIINAEDSASPKTEIKFRSIKGDGRVEVSYTDNAVEIFVPCCPEKPPPSSDVPPPSSYVPPPSSYVPPPSSYVPPPPSDVPEPPPNDDPIPTGEIEDVSDPVNDPDKFPDPINPDIVPDPIEMPDIDFDPDPIEMPDIDFSIDPIEDLPPIEMPDIDFSVDVDFSIDPIPELPPIEMPDIDFSIDPIPELPPIEMPDIDFSIDFSEEFRRLINPDG